jgi:hypothetical protein
MGRAMGQAVSCRPLKAESRVRAQVNRCGICGGQIGTGTGFLSEFFGFPLSISFHRLSPYSYINWGMKNMSSSGSSSETSHTIIIDQSVNQ